MTEKMTEKVSQSCIKFKQMFKESPKVRLKNILRHLGEKIEIGDYIYCTTDDFTKSYTYKLEVITLNLKHDIMVVCDSESGKEWVVNLTSYIISPREIKFSLQLEGMKVPHLISLSICNKRVWL